MRLRVFILLIFICGMAQAQTMQEQFDELKESSETFKDYKVIKIEKLDAFREGMVDSLSRQKELVDGLNNEIQNLNSRISTLNQEVASAKEGEEAALYDGEHINFAGIDFGKTTFTVIFLALVAILSTIIVIGFIRLKERNSTAKKKIVAYDKLNEDYEEYKKNALEKQMKLRRELQTERNKLAEIRSL